MRGLLGFGAILREMQDSHSAALVKHFATMAAHAFIGIRVSPAEKDAFRALARRERSTESALLKQLVSLMVRTAGAPGLFALEAATPPGRDSRLTVRLKIDDRLLLKERATARGMPAATYVSVLIRAHLRALAPLPKEELLTLRRSVTELAAVGRNLNQIARIGHQSGRITGPTREDLRAILKVCEGLRDHVRVLIKANVTSWQAGHANTHG